MTVGRWLLAGALAAAATVLGGCGASEEQSMDAAPADQSRPVVAITTTVVTTGSAVTRTVDDGASRGAVAPARHASVTTRAGDVEVAADGDALRVLRLATADGWQSTVDDSDPTRLVVTFRSDPTATGDGSVVVDIRLTAAGISSSTSEHLSTSG